MSATLADPRALAPGARFRLRGADDRVFTIVAVGRARRSRTSKVLVEECDQPLLFYFGELVELVAEPEPA